MPLLNEDIAHIEKHGFDKDSFSVISEGIRTLKNIDGKCVFLKGDRCSIYSIRPEGCKLYPLIYSRGKTILDNECPYNSEFDFSENETRRVLKAVEELYHF